MISSKGLTLTLLACAALFMSACSSTTNALYPAPGQQTATLPAYPLSDGTQPASPLYPQPLRQTPDFYPAPPGNTPSSPLTPPVGSAAAVLAAKEALSQVTGTALDDITLLAVEDVEWPDGCLGIYQPGQMCTQAIVPGYRVTLEADGQRYEFHTDRTGRRVILASPTRPQGSTPSSGVAPILEWA